jgi:hypothetical protein
MIIDGNEISLRGAETSIDVDAPLRIKDGASFVDVRSYIAPVHQYENLVVKNNAGTPNSQIDVSWDSLYIGAIHSTSYTQTLNIESDTDWDSGDHTDEPTSAWVYIWALAKIDGTEKIVFSLSATTLETVTGYVYSRRISKAYNDGSSNLSGYKQKNEFYNFSIVPTITFAGSATPADVTTAVTSAISPIDKTIFGNISGIAASGGVTYFLLGENDNIIATLYIHITGETGITTVVFPWMGTLKYKSEDVASPGITIYGCEIEL